VEIQSKPNIRHLNIDELKSKFIEIGQPSFRANQVWQWMWQKGVISFEEMTNIPKDIRIILDQNFSLYKMHVETKQISNDGTMKFGFRLFDGYLVEGVLIPQNDRMTACISSQVGCSLACSFCATAKLERKRNLFFDEIYDQVAFINQAAQEHYQYNLSNIVYMGMGEPLLNYTQVSKSIEMITSAEGLNMSPKRITVSTAGISKMIKKLADDFPKINLALSLHAPNDVKRDKIMGINESNDLESLEEALKYWFEKTQNRPTLEYVLLKDFNDSATDAHQLARFARLTPSKINLIEYNPIGDGQFEKSSRQTTDDFVKVLEDKKLIANVRRSRGEDIDAACGQLANKS